MNIRFKDPLSDDIIVLDVVEMIKHDTQKGARYRITDRLDRTFYVDQENIISIRDYSFDVDTRVEHNYDKKSQNKAIGISIDKEGNYQLDYYFAKYVQEYNRIEITSRQLGISFGVNADMLVDFIGKNKDVIFEDF